VKSTPIRLLAADPHPVVTDGMACAVLGRPGLTWMGGVGSLAELLEVATGPEDRPHVAVIGLDLGPATQVGATIRQLRDSGVGVVIFTASLRPVPIRAAVEAGARGVALMVDPAAALMDVIEAVAIGEFAVSSGRARMLVGDAHLTPRLAPREVEVLHLLASGLPRKAIGGHMHPPVAMTTVVTYLNRVCEKYRAIGRPVACPADALRAAAEDGYLDLAATHPGVPGECAS
jgi:DNA-binding NarL/FixJ family response regulator